MCGITGFWTFKDDLSKSELLNIVKKMSDQIDHRGPDSSGEWYDEKSGIALGHRRLSIVDLSPMGHQPMISHSGRSVIIYNGEIYNTSELRNELIAQGYQFKGHSDTEVILEACELWGVEATCKRLIGMFAFAVWDKENRKLSLVRDRLGIKPLYWGFNQGVLFFGSQLKSFSVHPKWRSEIDKSALVSYFRYNYVPAPVSIFKDIHKLTPGTILTINADKTIHTNRFWDFQSIADNSIKNKTTKNDYTLIEELDLLLRDAVKRRMVADVPLGAFLSGGIDSSTVVALMQAQSDRPIKTFSIGFNEAEYNEALYAKKVAQHLGTDHHELYLESSEAMDIIPTISLWCDEPFADVSQIPTFLVSRLARQHVTVSLSGDGGDELFAGYNRYLYGQSIWRWLNVLPIWFKRAGAMGIRSVSPNQWDRFLGVLPKNIRSSFSGDKLHKLTDVLTSSSIHQFYKLLVSFWNDPSNLVLGGNREMSIAPWTDSLSSPHENFIEMMQRMDTLTYLPDDILTKVDRASMAVSLEARVPILDHRVVEFAWKLPMEAKIRAGQSKWLLRQVLNKYVPKKLIDRPKMGFAVPIERWLRGPLREWAETLLSEEKLRNGNILNPAPIRKRWEEHLKGSRNWQYSLWGVLMFQAWREKWVV